MDKIILIDNELLCFLKATESLEQAECWADILAPTHDFLITGVESERAFSVYTHFELRLLYQNTTGQGTHESMEYSTLLKGVYQIAEELIVDETSLEDLKKKAGKSRKKNKVDCTTDTAPVPDTKKKKTSSTATKVPGRPKEGSTTAKVWGIADTMHADDPGLGFDSKDFRKCVMEECEKQGINKATAATQFGKWKKHLNNT